MGTVGIFYLSREIAYHAVAGVVDAHVGVVGPRLGLDGVLETGGFERHVPVFNSLDEIGHPLLGRSRVYVVYDGLHGFYQPSLTIGFYIARHQTVTGDERLTLGLVLGVRETGEIVDKVTHALVPETLAHRLAGQQHHRRVHAQGHLDVDGKHLHGVDIRAAAYHSAELDHAQRGSYAGGQLVVVLEEIGNLYHASALGALADYLERRHDGVDGRCLESLGYTVGRVGQLGEHVGTHVHRLVVVLLKIDGGLVDLFAGILAEVLGHSRIARHAHEVAAQERVGYLEVPLVLDVAHGEETFLHGATLLDDVGILVLLLFGYGVVVMLGGVGLDYGFALEGVVVHGRYLLILRSVEPRDARGIDASGYHRHDSADKQLVTHIDTYLLVRCHCKFSNNNPYQTWADRKKHDNHEEKSQNRCFRP